MKKTITQLQAENALLNRALDLACAHMHGLFIGCGFKPHTARKIHNYFMRLAQAEGRKGK